MDISSLRERHDIETLTVTQLNNTVKSMIENTAVLQRVSIRGELSNVNLHTSGHLYFTLKDDESQIKCVMFRASAVKLKFMPKEGMKVIVGGSVGVYARGGTYQLYATTMHADGVGDLYLQFLQIKQRLEEEGLFDEDHKLPLPSFPQKIGVITSPTGAAVRDIINVCSRRYPLAHLYLYPSLVQGDGAEENLIRALDYFDQSKLCDVLIIGRGGGSIEDLWAFNSERLARRIFEMQIPVVSAVGHETDFTICDFVSDLRAPTPSAAAEIVTPDARSVVCYIDEMIDKMAKGLHRKTDSLSSKLESLSSRPALTKAESVTLPYENRLADVFSALQRVIEAPINDSGKKLGVLAASLDALSPLSVLSRGYAVVKNDSGNAVRNAAELEVGDKIYLRLSNGGAAAEITEIQRS